MKKLVIIALIAFSFLSCDKDDGEDCCTMFVTSKTFIRTETNEAGVSVDRYSITTHNQCTGTVSTPGYNQNDYNYTVEEGVVLGTCL